MLNEILIALIADILAEVAKIAIQESVEYIKNIKKPENHWYY